MKYIKLKLLILTFFFCLIPIYSQEHSLGAILDPVRYEQIKTKPVLITRNYTTDIPRSYNIKQYSPVPESQSPYPTCVGWATTFAACTITDSITVSRTDTVQITNNAFSPYYTYRNSKIPPVHFFEEGMQIYDALDFLKEKGAVRRLPSEKAIPWINLPLALYAGAKHFTISDYETLFKYGNTDYRGLTKERKVNPVRKSLSEKHPVVIAIRVYSSFDYAYGKDLWEPVRGDSFAGNHAMCVVGYDDDKYGGAFEIMNSWGTDWGNGGFIWIKYDDFAEYVYEAYELIEDPNNYRDSFLYGASIEIEVDNDPRGMSVIFDQQGFYRTRTSYPTWTTFRFYMTNRYPARVYAFSTDTNESSLERIFPMPGVSPLLNYSESTVEWPGKDEYGENQSMRLYGDAGTDYLVVLYSKTELDIDAIEKRFINEKGTFPERVALAVSAVAGNFMPYNSVQYAPNRMEFSANTLNPTPVFGLLLAIDHR